MRKFIFLITLFTFCSAVAQSTNDCVDAIQLCGSTPVGLDPDGVGFDEFSLPDNFEPPCYSFSNNTAWFKIVVETGGYLGFDLIPDNATDDYDFAIYGPVDDCSFLGSSIRCSSTNPGEAGVPAVTGLNETANDIVEGPGADGDGYLKWLTVNTGETYYLLIDRAHGSQGFQINLTGNATLPTPPEFNEPSDLLACDDDDVQDGYHTFDLTPQTYYIGKDNPDAIVTHHATLNDANLGIKALKPNYRNTKNPQTIFTRIASKNSGCIDITTFKLKVQEQPYTLNDIYLCDMVTPYAYDLNTLSMGIANEDPNLNISYYNSYQDAKNETNAVSTKTVIDAENIMFVKIQNEVIQSCTVIDSFKILLVDGPVLSSVSDIYVCKDDRTQITYDLEAKKDEIISNLGSSDYTVKFYDTIPDRDLQQNELPSSYLTSSISKPIYFSVVDNETGCILFEDFEIVVQQNPEFTLPEELFYCLNSEDALTIRAPSGFKYYKWSTGDEGAARNTVQVRTGGDYWVTVSNDAGCTSTQNTTVVTSDIASAKGLQTSILNYPDNEITITVDGVGDYEYSLDQGIYTPSNHFEKVSMGYHNIIVRDKNGCGAITVGPFLVLDYPRFFTPNNDGYNDRWEVIGLSEFPGYSLHIFDRFGKMLKQITEQAPYWDGSYNGKKLPSGDYWFSLELTDNLSTKGHFSLLSN